MPPDRRKGFQFRVRDFRHLETPSLVNPCPGSSKGFPACPVSCSPVPLVSGVSLQFLHFPMKIPDSEAEPPLQFTPPSFVQYKTSSFSASDRCAVAASIQNFLLFRFGCLRRRFVNTKLPPFLHRSSSTILDDARSIQNLLLFRSSNKTSKPRC